MCIAYSLYSFAIMTLGNFESWMHFILFIKPCNNSWIEFLISVLGNDVFIIENESCSFDFECKIIRRKSVIKQFIREFDNVSCQDLGERTSSFELLLIIIVINDADSSAVQRISLFLVNVKIKQIFLKST